MVNVKLNSELNGIEIAFDSVPTESTRNGLKSNGFRWHKVKKVWYAKQTADRLTYANSLSELKAITSESVKTENKFDFNVKVGDIFECSWGYEQTNVDFFQVVKLVGSKSVRVVEVRPQLVNDNPTCSMASDRTYKLTNELLPPIEHSSFINDNVNGDLKRIKSYDKDAFNNPMFEVGNGGYSCHKCKGDTITCYESWYY